MSLRTSLNAADFEPSALEGDKAEASQASNQNPQPQEPNQSQGGQPQHEPAIPYPRFQEVTHENQALRAKIQEYERQKAQAQQYNQAPSPISGMQGNPYVPQPQQQLNAQEQQQFDSFKAQLKDPNKAKEWQAKIAKEGPQALHDFVDAVIRESGSQLLGQYIRPILEKVSMLEGDYVSNTINQYVASVNDPEFPAYRHLFENTIRQVAPNYNVRDPQVLDTVRYWAQAQYRAQYGNPPQGQQVPQPNTFQQPQYQQQQPPISERPGNSFGFSNQGTTQNKYAAIDAQLAQRLGIDVAEIQANRARTVRGG